MVGGLRKAADGVMFIGTKKKSRPDSVTGNKQILNDFVVKGTGQAESRHRGQHMSIRYSIEQRAFLVRDLGTGLGCFGRIDKPLAI